MGFFIWKNVFPKLHQSAKTFTKKKLFTNDWIKREIPLFKDHLSGEHISAPTIYQKYITHQGHVKDITVDNCPLEI